MDRRLKVTVTRVAGKVPEAVAESSEELEHCGQLCKNGSSTTRVMGMKFPQEGYK